MNIAAVFFALGMAGAQTLPSGPLVVRDFTLRFDPAGTFTLSGVGWPPMAGTWTARGGEVSLQNSTGPKDCMNPARYSFTVDGARVSLAMVADDCKVRQMILDRQPVAATGRVTRRGGAAHRADAGPGNRRTARCRRHRSLAVVPRT